MKNYLAAVITASLLFFSVYASIVSAEEQTNTGNNKNINAIAAQYKKTSQDINSKGVANEIKILQSGMSDIDKRNNEIEQRVAQLEEKNSKNKSVGSWLVMAAEKVIADAVGFSLFALIVVFALKREFKHTVREGLVGIGHTFADAFVSSVVPLIKSFSEDATSILRDKSFSSVNEAGLSAPAIVDKKLGSVQILIDNKKYHDAEKELKKLSDEYPKELKIVAKLYELYDMPEFAAISDLTALAKNCLHFLEYKKPAFSEVADFYYLLSFAYTKFAGTGKNRNYYKLALEAANKAIELEPKFPRWYSLRGLVHHLFGVSVDAITSTEVALRLATEQSDNEGAARAKNNLAYYYAEVGQNSMKEQAIAFAKDACQHDIGNKLKYPFSLDTLGYVLMMYGESQEELEESVEVLVKSASLEPGDRVISDHLSEARRRLESFSKADC